MFVQKQIIINAEPSVIFEYLMDVKNRTSYIPALEEVKLLDGMPIKIGSRCTEVATIAGRRIETTYQVIELIPNKHTAAKTIKSIFPIRADLWLSPENDGTQLTIELTFTLKGIFKLASGIVQTIVGQQASEILEKIKSEVEGMYTSTS